MSQREDFEEAAARLGISLQIRNVDSEDGEYWRAYTRVAWDMWQECCALKAKAEPQSAVPEWIKCSERMPTQADSDYNSDVWYYDEITGEVELAFVLHAHGYTHWRPTGLKPPAKPQQGQES